MLLHTFREKGAATRERDGNETLSHPKMRQNRAKMRHSLQDEIAGFSLSLQQTKEQVQPRKY